MTAALNLSLSGDTVDVNGIQTVTITAAPSTSLDLTPESAVLVTPYFRLQTFGAFGNMMVLGPGVFQLVIGGGVAGINITANALVLRMGGSMLTMTPTSITLQAGGHTLALSAAGVVQI